MKFKIELEPGNPLHWDINSYSVDRLLGRPEGLDAQELRNLAYDAVYTVAAECVAAGAKDVSHVKLFIDHENGFLHANSVSGSPQITVNGRDGRTTRQFRMALIAVIFGLQEEAIAKAAEQALETVETQYGLTRQPGLGKKL